MTSHFNVNRDLNQWESFSALFSLSSPSPSLSKIVQSDNQNHGISTTPFRPPSPDDWPFIGIQKKKYGCLRKACLPTHFLEPSATKGKFFCFCSSPFTFEKHYDGISSISTNCNYNNVIDIEKTKRRNYYPNKISPDSSFFIGTSSCRNRNRNLIRRYSLIQDFRDSFRSLIIPSIFLTSISVPLLTYYIIENNKNLLFKFAYRKENLYERQRIKKEIEQSPKDKVEEPRNSSLTVIFASLSNERKLLMFGKLIISILIDLIGDGNLVFPISEQYDIIWAFFSAFLIRSLYQSWALALVNFIEEILPLVDVIPTATTAWLIELLSFSVNPENNNIETITTQQKYLSRKDNKEVRRREDNNDEKE